MALPPSRLEQARAVLARAEELSGAPKAPSEKMRATPPPDDAVRSPGRRGNPRRRARAGQGRPLGDTEALPAGDTDTSPAGATEALPSGDTEALPAGDTDTSPAGDTDTSPAGATDALPAEEVDPPPPDPQADPRFDPDADPDDVARSIVLRQLAMAPRTRRQLEDKLAVRGCDPEVGRRVLERMERVGLVDDEAYAEMLVRSQQVTRGLARRALGHELRRKGIEDDLVQASLAGIDDEEEAERARALVATKLRTLHGLARPVQQRRLAGLLARKGYPPSLSYRIVSEALDAAPEHRRD